MKKIGWGLAIIVAMIIAVLAWSYRDVLVMMRTFSQMEPAHRFADEPASTPPDYSLPASWAALPDRRDGADVVPATLVDEQASAAVDVFFIHPTTYYSPDHWNQPVSDVIADRFTDVFVMRNQASAFNGCCRVYAPRYRQATIYSFIGTGPDGQQALSLAYTDVERAFDYFLENLSGGRPFILASHSQGTVHLRSLLEKRISGTPLVERLVAAYAIGFPIKATDYLDKAPDVTVCREPSQLHCIVSWNAVGPNARVMSDPTGNICVNPLTWRADGERADFAVNPGAVSFNRDYSIDIESLRDDPDFVPHVEPAIADAQCEQGRLLVSEIRSDNFRGRPTGRDSYHIYDFGLFYMSLRANAQQRARAYLETRQSNE